MDPQPNAAYPQSPAPVGQLKTNRSLVKYILLSIVTLGIYSIVFFSGVSSDINVAASRYDGKKTMHYALLFFIFFPLTAGIALFVWMHKISNRIGAEANRRGLGVDFSATTFWLWYFLGSMIIVGPFIYMHKLSTVMNGISEHYNTNG